MNETSTQARQENLPPVVGLSSKRSEDMAKEQSPMSDALRARLEKQDLSPVKKFVFHVLPLI